VSRGGVDGQACRGIAQRHRGIATMGAAQAATPPPVTRSASYADLLTPISNAVALLQADDAARATATANPCLAVLRAASSMVQRRILRAALPLAVGSAILEGLRVGAIAGAGLLLSMTAELLRIRWQVGVASRFPALAAWPLFSWPQRCMVGTDFAPEGRHAPTLAGVTGA